MKGELGEEKNNCSDECMCQAGPESEVHVWSGISTAHGDTCAI